MGFLMVGLENSIGGEALRALEVTRYHLVLMDIRMPGMDELEIT